MKLILWGGGCLVFLLSIITSCVESRSEVKLNKVKHNQPQNILTVNSDTLVIAYSSDIEIANQKYYNNLLNVSGSVGSINQGENNEPYLIFKSNVNHLGPQPEARFIKSEFEKARNLSIGQNITLQCFGNSEVLGIPLLRECIIQ